MAFTGELEHLHIVDIIQLIHSTRKSGTFAVKGSKGESCITFSNGYIVSANHLNGRVRIGTVLLKMNAVTPEGLEEALNLQKKAGKDRKPLLATLVQMGKLTQEHAFKGLKKLIEITVVDLLGWTAGTFTLDTDAIVVSAECNYVPGAMNQEMSLDAQMVLMDALRIFDERERDRQAGKEVQAYEEFYADVLSREETAGTGKGGSTVTAEDLGLADLDHLENKIPEPLTGLEVFDPAEIHRQKVKELLADFPSGEQEALVSFLKKAMERVSPTDASARKDAQARALIFFSRDKLMKYSVMTICKIENVLVFATDDEEELHRIVSQCLSRRITPVLVFDSPGTSEAELPDEILINLRRRVRERYLEASVLQLAPPLDYVFTLECYREGVRAVLPRPSKTTGRGTFVHDTISFLEAFKSYAEGFSLQQPGLSSDGWLRKLRERIGVLRSLHEPADVSLALLQAASEMFQRCITLIVRQTEVVGDRAIGVDAEKSAGPTPATRLKIPLAKPSLFREVIDKGRLFYGERSDSVLKEHLYDHIGAPLRSTILILPLMINGKVVALTYGDFGEKEGSLPSVDVLEIMAHQAGAVLESALCRKQVQKVSQK